MTSSGRAAELDRLADTQALLRDRLVRAARAMILVEQRRVDVSLALVAAEPPEVAPRHAAVASAACRNVDTVLDVLVDVERRLSSLEPAASGAALPATPSV